MKDDKIIGRKFGRLTVIKKTLLHRAGEKKDRFYYYECVCDCEKEKENPKTIVVRGTNLTSGNTKSCGCFRKEIGSERFSNLHKENFLGFIEKTGVKLIESIIENRYKGRGSKKRFGVNGIYIYTQITPTHKVVKFASRIKFQYKNFELGGYDTAEQAIKIRKEAEQNLYGNFLEWYYNTFPEKKKKKQKALA